jgi:hypothetical protein
MSDPFEDPDFKSAFDKFSSENGGEFNLLLSVPLQDKSQHVIYDFIYAHTRIETKQIYISEEEEEDNSLLSVPLKDKSQHVISANRSTKSVIYT